MEYLNDLLFVMIGTAVITALFMAILLRGRPTYQPPEFYYAPPRMAMEQQGTGCLPLIVLMGVIIAALTLAN